MDKITGLKAERKGLNETLAYVQPGDTFIVWKLDRAGRSLKHLMELLKDLQGRNIEFVSITEQIDTTTPGGKLIFHLMGALAEFERDLIRERTNAGLAAARARGRIGGQPVIRSRPTGKWRWLDRCLPIRVIPSQRSVQPWRSPAPLCIDMSKRLNRSPNCQEFRERNSKIYTVARKFLRPEQQYPRLLLVSHRVLEILVSPDIYDFLEMTGSCLYQGTE